MELRRELRMEANVFAEDDDLDASDGENGDDAVVGTPARPRAARRPTAASKGTSRPSSRAFESPSRSHRVGDFKDVLSPMRGLGSATIAERRPEPTPKPSRRRRGADVVATPTRSEAPPARSAALADRLVLAPPSSCAPRSATRGRDRARAGRGGDAPARRERLRSPSLDRLAGTYRALGALATQPAGPERVSSTERVSSSASSSAHARHARAARAPGGSREANPSARSRRGEAEPPPEPSLRYRRDAERDRRERPRRATSSAASGVGAKKTDEDAKKPRASLEGRPETLSRVSGGTNPMRWRTVIEYDLNGRRVERKVLAPPPSARGRPAWSSRPGASSGSIRVGSETGSRKTRGSRANAMTKRLASRPAFDPGPGGLGVDHRAIEASRRGASRTPPETPVRPVRETSARRAMRYGTSRFPVRNRPATSPSPAPARRKRDGSRDAPSSSFDASFDDRAFDASFDDRAFARDRSEDARSNEASPRSVSEGSEPARARRASSDSESNYSVGSDERAERRATPSRTRGVAKRAPSAEKKTSDAPASFGFDRTAGARTGAKKKKTGDGEREPVPLCFSRRRESDEPVRGRPGRRRRHIHRREPGRFPSRRLRLLRRSRAPELGGRHFVGSAERLGAVARPDAVHERAPSRARRLRRGVGVYGVYG